MIERTASRLRARLQLRSALCWVLLGLARFVIVALPFAAVRRLITAGAATGRAEAPAAESRLPLARRIGAVTERAARRTPWRSDCFPQALAVKFQLVCARVPHTLVFGLRRTSAGELTAHCWVCVAGHPVVGGDPREYTPVNSFTWNPPSVPATNAPA